MLWALLLASVVLAAEEPSLELPAAYRDLYESEIFGEALLLRLVDVARSDRERLHLATLLQLETETKARLRPLLFRHRLPLSEQMPLDSLDDMVKGFLASTWEHFCAGLVPVTDQFLGRFRQIAEGALSEEDKAIAESMVEHEQAIHDWAELEGKGPSDDSLDKMARLLQWPIMARFEE